MECESHTSALVDIEAVALVDIVAIAEVGQDVPDQMVPSATAEILVAEYSGGECSYLRIGVAFSFSSLPSPDACSQSQWPYPPMFGSQHTQWSSTVVEVHHSVLPESILVS